MSRQPLLTATERENLLALPTDESELIRLTTFSDQDIQLINQHRGDASRLGFAIQLCYLRYPGRVLEDGESPPPALLKEVAKHLKVSASQWPQYFQRGTTRREHPPRAICLSWATSFYSRSKQTGCQPLDGVGHPNGSRVGAG